MTRELAKGYEPAQVEDKWRDYWEQNGSYAPENGPQGEPYSIVIPPPNVTGHLHMGHALNLTVQDILCRHMRQQGRKVLWVPGMDHAGIATQNVVERKLKEEGLTRHDLGREKFIDRVWEWKEEYGGKILRQIRAMGASVDWSRERFTMDEGLSEAVREVFVRLYDEGLVYKGDYIINWCVRCHTALADDEVEHIAKKDKLYLLKYPLKGNTDQALVVATTRPETMFGDTAVAVNPEDERFNGLIGHYATLPIVGRDLVIIGDSYVDTEFGTGCLKVTPAHDTNDYELGMKHGLESVQVIDEKGFMNENAGPYAGLAKEEARTRVLEDLDKEGLLVEVQDLEHNVGHCYRCKSVIEPHVSTQWFVAVKPLAAKAKAAVAEGRTRILPENWTKTYDHWLDNIRDWCVSRQLWWGHRIPAWTCRACDRLIVARQDPDACACGSTDLVQDEDVLDTWFSSALWPFSTLGWPEETEDLRTFYPTSCLVTGFDILFFWVARMMMMGLHFRDDVPFKDVYIHALVRDAEGRKMSKSLGNSIDPLDMIERFGTDSLRFTLAAFAAMGRDIRLSEDRIEGYRHFVNKLWNAARFALMHLPSDMQGGGAAGHSPEPTLEATHHAWLFSRLETVKQEVADAVADYRFNEAANTLYTFTWREFCDWYVECIKPELQSEEPGVKEAARNNLRLSLRDILILMHPFMPFVTQEIWSCLPGVGPEEENLALQPYPQYFSNRRNNEAESAFGLIQETVTAVRNIRGELGIGPAKELSCLVKTSGTGADTVYDANTVLLTTLARLSDFTHGPDVVPPKAGAGQVVRGHELSVDLTGAIDFAAELARLDKELTKNAKDHGIVSKKLANKGFTDKAPADVVQKERDRLAEIEEKKEKLEGLRERLAEAAEV